MDATLEALADPTRRRIVELLGRAPMRAGAVAQEFTLAAPTVSRHLRVLRRAGLIEELRVDLPGDDTDDPRLRARDARAERAYARETAGASPAEAAAVATEIANEIREADSAAGKDPAETPLNPGKE